MIFITLGSQKFQFNRLLKAIDKLVEQGKIKEEVFAQIGISQSTIIISNFWIETNLLLWKERRI